MSFSEVKQKLANIDYSWTKPKTYVVFVPGLSLIIQKIQFAKVLPLIVLDSMKDSEKARAADFKSRKFATICKWHLLGSITQSIACIIVVNVFALPLFSLLGLIPSYELVNTLSKTLLNKATICEFYDNGSVKQINFVSAFSLF